MDFSFERINVLKTSISEESHFQQKENWDCGLACIHMILQECGKQPDWNDLLIGVRTRSVWTIDLATLLLHNQIRFAYVTRVLGVQQSYRSSAFYKNEFEEDYARICQLFVEAESQKMQMKQATVSDEELLSLMKMRHLAIIALVDAKKLCTEMCGCPSENFFDRKCNHYMSKSTESCDESYETSKAESYQGHYILLCGYDDASQDFLYRDPSKVGGVDRMKKEQLNLARTSQGTDEDLLIIDLLRSGKRPSPQEWVEFMLNYEVFPWSEMETIASTFQKVFSQAEKLRTTATQYLSTLGIPLPFTLPTPALADCAPFLFLAFFIKYVHDMNLDLNGDWASFFRDQSPSFYSVFG